MKIAEIYLKQKNKRIDKVYEYLVPEEAKIGQRVSVKFGKGNRTIEGIIINLKKSSNFEGELKEIDKILDEEPLLNEDQIKLSQFIQEKTNKLFYDCLKYFTTFSKVTKSSKGELKAYRPKEIIEVELIEDKKVRGSIQQKVISLLKEKSYIVDDLKKEIPSLKNQTLKRLEELGIIKLNIKIEDFSKVNDEEVKVNQKFVNKDFIKIVDLNYFTKFTETIEESSSGQLLIIFPNNFLASRFTKYLNTNSSIKGYFYKPESNKIKYDFYQKVKDGSYKVIIGTYAALFLHFNNLKNIIITFFGDESYYSSKTIPFNIVELTEKLAEITGANIIGCDFIDSIDSNFKVQHNLWNYQKELSQLNNFNVKVVSLSNFNNNSIILSDELKSDIEKTLDNGQKVLLLMNRKGYYNYYVCTNCKETIKCPRCGSAVKSIKSGKKVSCKVCGFESDFPSECPYCGNKDYEALNYGLDRVATELFETFPRHKVGIYFKEHKDTLENYDIIVGTRQLLYHPNLKNIGLVGSVLIDLDLNYPDYHAPESAYRLYSELFQRYPNSIKYIQTANSSRDFRDAFQAQPEDFLYNQANYRYFTKMPPYFDCYMITVTGENTKMANDEVKLLIKILKDKLPELEILPYYNIREIKGTSQRRFIVKDQKDGNFTNILKDMYDDGEIESLNSKVSIIKNPANIV